MDGHLALAKLSTLCNEGLFDSDEIPSALMAATFAEALRQGSSPRRVLDALWEAVPADDAWDAVAEKLVAACEEIDEGGG